jgi:hypothetical protein
MPHSADGALRRVCALVEHDGAGWTVGGEPAEALADALYAGWYTRPAVPPPPAGGDPPLTRRSLLPALRAAHASAASLATGWTVTGSTPRGTLSAVRAAQTRILRPGEYRMPLRPGVPPAPGEPVEPVARLDQFDSERLLWWAFTDPAPQPPLGRVYLDARPATAARAIHELTAALGELPHQFKCPVLARACERVDAIVVYHARGDRERVLDALEGRWPRLGALLDPAVPALTCAVRPGLAWADDLDADHSFGELRCRQLAGAIGAAADAWHTGGPDDRLELLSAGLRAEGVDPHAPWSAAA